MTLPSRMVLLIASVTSALITSCATDNGNGACTPGTTIACSCENGATGSQSCTASGGYTDCSCGGGSDAGGSVDASESLDMGDVVDAGMTDAPTTDGTRPRPDGSVLMVSCITAASCDDDDACTDDSCVLGTCVNTAISCSDDDPCTIHEMCVEGACVHDTMACADDADPCTDAACDAEHEGCYQAPHCDDAIDCTVDSCGPSAPGSPLIVCNHSATNSLCNDGNPSTVDSCSEALGGCIHIGG